MQGFECRMARRSGTIGAVGTGVTFAGLGRHPGATDTTFLKIKGAVPARPAAGTIAGTVAGLIVTARNLAILATTAFQNPEPHPDSPYHGAKRQKFWKRRNHLEW